MKLTYRRWITEMCSFLQKLVLICVGTFSAYGCQDRKEEKDIVPAKAKVETPSASVPSLVNTDTLTIDTKAAVLYSPDSIQMKKRMQAVGEEDFRVGADDYIYYMNTSAEYLEKQGLMVLDAKDNKYIRFVSSDKTAQVIKLDTLSELWGIYFFDPKKTPYLADITLIEEEYTKYYK